MGKPAEKERETVTVKVETEVEVPMDWIDYLKYSDLFSRDYIGYWAYGAYRTKRGWLVFVGGDFSNERIGAAPTPAELADAKRAWANALPMPKGFHVLDKDAMLAAYAEGCKKWGFDWYDRKGDSNTYDVVIQLVLLKGVVYG